MKLELDENKIFDFKSHMILLPFLSINNFILQVCAIHKIGRILLITRQILVKSFARDIIIDS